MRYAIWESNEDRHVFDPGPYVGWLKHHADELPPGARAFATSATHYDYYAYRTRDEDVPPGSALCTKDLLLRSVDLLPEEELSVELCFLFPGFELEEVGTFDLVLHYLGVARFEIVETQGHPRRVPSGLSHLMIDEVVPANDGILHEIAVEFGTVIGEAMDLVAVWR